MYSPNSPHLDHLAAVHTVAPILVRGGETTYIPLSFTHLLAWPMPNECMTHTASSSTTAATEVQGRRQHQPHCCPVACTHLYCSHNAVLIPWTLPHLCHHFLPLHPCCHPPPLPEHPTAVLNLSTVWILMSLLPFHLV